MTAAEFHTNFKFRMDKLDSLNYPGFESTEIDMLLNQAQERFVKQRYGINNNKRQSFEETQKRTDDLRNIVKRVSITPQATQAANKPNGVFVQLPTTLNQEFWFAVNEECDITYEDCHEEDVTVRVPIRPIQHDDYNKTIKDPFDKPWKEEIIRLASDTFYELISDTGITIGTYYLTYLKKPINISLTNNVTSELAEHTHSEIVDLAVQIALEGIEAKRQQTFPSILNTDE